MNTVIYILCLLVLIVLVCEFILISSLHKHNGKLKGVVQEEHELLTKISEINQKVDALWLYIKFSSDANEMMLWKIRYNFFNMKEKLTNAEQFEQAQQIQQAIVRTDMMITYYRKELMNPENEQNNQKSNG